VADAAGKSEQDLLDSDMDFESMINGVNSFELWAKNSILCDPTKDLYCHESAGNFKSKGRCRRCSESPDERQCNDVKRIKDAENGLVRSLWLRLEFSFRLLVSLSSFPDHSNSHDSNISVERNQ